MIDNEKKLTRFDVLIIIMLIIFFSIIIRLIYLQIKNVDEYKDKADRKAIKEISEVAPRGNILDRNGAILAGNKQSYMISFMETDESKAKFFDTMEMVFKILDENGEKQNDDFELNINPFRFEFNSSDSKVIKAREIRFKKDRGFDDEIIKKIYPDRRKEDLNEEEWKEIDALLLKITPEEAFNKLWEQYTDEYLNDENVDDGLKQKIKSYDIQEKRRFIVVKDAIKMQSFSGYKPIIVASNIKKETAFLFYQQLSQLPGIDVVLQPIRDYPNGELASSVLGYISKINPEQKDKYEEKGYDVNTDLIGISGIENVFEERIKGSKGVKIVEVNSHGRMINEKARREPYPGQNVQLTIDKDVQYAAEKSLEEQMKKLQSIGMHSDGVNTSNANRGAAIAIDVNTGGVIAMASKPSFDPNDFVTGNLSEDLVNEYFHPDLEDFGNKYISSKGLAKANNKSQQEMLDWLFPIDKSIKNNSTIRQDYYDICPKPLYNYAIQTLMPPGSTFKPVTALAGLEENVITPDELITDEGVFNKYLSSYQGACWKWNEYHGTHGSINVAKALEESCNYFFYEVSQRLYEKGGYDLLAEYAWKLGLGVDPNSDKNQNPTTGIEFSDIESFGQVYNIEYAKKNKIAVFINSLVDDLKSGTDRQGNHYKAGINLEKDHNDSDEVKKIKDKIIEIIKGQMLGEKVEFDKTSNELAKCITKLTKSDKELKDLNFSKEDIDKATNAIMIAIYDGHQEIMTEANLYDAAIGQGISVFTPLQLCNYISTLVNGGTRYKVHLVDKYLDQNNNVIQEIKPQVMDEVDISPQNLEVIKDGMAKVTSGEDGTAAGVFDGFPIANGGKTGSATLSSFQDLVGRTAYAVYVGFAPIDDPQIAVCIVVFDGGHGGYVAPVARSMYEAYFKDELINEYNYVPGDDFMQEIFKQD